MCVSRSIPDSNDWFYEEHALYHTYTLGELYQPARTGRPRVHAMRKLQTARSHYPPTVSQSRFRVRHKYTENGSLTHDTVSI